MTAKVQQFVENSELRIEIFTLFVLFYSEKHVFCAQRAYLRNKRNNF